MLVSKAVSALRTDGLGEERDFQLIIHNELREFKECKGKNRLLSWHIAAMEECW